MMSEAPSRLVRALSWISPRAASVLGGSRSGLLEPDITAAQMESLRLSLAEECSLEAEKSHRQNEEQQHLAQHAVLEQGFLALQEEVCKELEHSLEHDLEDMILPSFELDDQGENS